MATRRKILQSTRKRCALLTRGAIQVAAVALGCAPAADPPAQYRGTETCVGCHAEEATRWRGSHHDLAMQPATDETILGDFNSSTVTAYGRTSRFYRDGDRFLVHTQGADGADHEFQIRYTFGVTPLQQYLIAFPGGRFQALGLAWDTRPRSEGGQRWFQLYPDEDIPPGDRLHWTGPAQRWNYQCAACHSTNLQKHYDPTADVYATSYADLDVGCEACHGPGSRHVALAERGADAPGGLSVDLRRSGAWRFAGGAAIASHETDPSAAAQIAACAYCHSRRQVILESPAPGGELLDGIRPALLDEPLYYPDGQIRDEVYVYGSFLQSRMYAQGVTCSDCHDPHTLQLKGEGNGVCTVCHLASTYDQPDHHFHRSQSAGARCVECHMPRTTYMVVDPRRDHSLRIPRPDLSVQFDTPNACTMCHAEQSNEWAAEAVRRWYGPPDRRPPHASELLARGRSNTAAGNAALARLTGDSTVPAIVRATAVRLLGRHGAPQAQPAIVHGIRDPDPLVRLAAAGAGEILPPPERYATLSPALRDPARAVRDETARVLAALPAGSVPPPAQAAIDSALAGFIASAMVNADRPEAHLNVAVAYQQRGRWDDADRSLQMALRLDSTFVPAYVNLAELRRAQGRDAEGDPILRAAIRVAPRDGSAHHALGLLLVRQRRYGEAVEELGQAVELNPDDPRFVYVYAVALNSTGAPEQAVAVLRAASAHHPTDLDILSALASISRDRGDLTGAIDAARRLVALRPDDQSLQQFLQSLLDRERD